MRGCKFTAPVSNNYETDFRQHNDLREQQYARINSAMIDDYSEEENRNTYEL